MYITSERILDYYHIPKAQWMEDVTVVTRMTVNESFGSAHLGDLAIYSKKRPPLEAQIKRTVASYNADGFISYMCPQMKHKEALEYGMQLNIYA